MQENHKFDNLTDEQKNRIERTYDILMPLNVILNGISVGGMIRNSRFMIENGYDNQAMLSVLLYLGCALHTGRSIYRMYQDKKHMYNNRQR